MRSLLKRLTTLSAAILSLVGCNVCSATGNPASNDNADRQTRNALSKPEGSWSYFGESWSDFKTAPGLGEPLPLRSQDYHFPKTHPPSNDSELEDDG